MRIHDLNLLFPLICSYVLLLIPGFVWLCLTVDQSLFSISQAPFSPSKSVCSYVITPKWHCCSLGADCAFIAGLIVNRRQTFNHHVSRPPGTAPAVPSTYQIFSRFNTISIYGYSTFCVS